MNNLIQMGLLELYVEQIADDHDRWHQIPTEVQVASYQFECDKNLKMLSMKRLWSHIIRTLWLEDGSIVSINDDLEEHVEEYLHRPRRIIRCEK